MVTTLLPNPVIPTFDRRHCAAIREGAQSAEVWSNNQKREWHESYDGPPADLKKLKEVEDAGKPLPEGGKKSSGRDEKAVRGKKGKTGILRQSKQRGKRKDKDGEDQERLQQRREAAAKKARARKKKTA